MSAANVNRLAACAVDLLDEVRLAASASEWFVAEDQLAVHHERRFRHEEPFALTAKDPVLARVTLAGRDLIARERITNVLGLERIHGLAHRRRASRHGGNEPFAFVVAAEEAVKLRLLAWLAHEQMTLLRLGLHDGYVQRFPQGLRDTEFEEFPVIVAADVNGVIWLGDVSSRPNRHQHPTRRNLADFQTSAHSSELGLNLLCIHTF
jgi:hypothetical protein